MYIRWPLLVLLISSQCFADVETGLGEIGVSEILVKPQFIIQEPQEGKFNLDEVSATLDWEYNFRTSARIRFGRQDLISPPSQFVEIPENQFGLFEAYGEINSPFGKFRFGLIPLNYGIEGSWSESNLNFPRSLIFSNQVVGLRDFGIGWKASHNNYFTEFVVHNGEGQENQDGRIWYTASWGWNDRDRLKLGLAGQTGTTKPESTSSSTTMIAGFNKNQDAKWRLGGPFILWLPNDFQILLEASFGEMIQEGKETNYFVGHFDTIYDWNDKWGIQLRYDHLDPNQKIKDDLLREVSLGVHFKADFQTSVFYLMFTKVIEEDNEIGNDIFRFVWRLTPNLPQFL